MSEGESPFFIGMRSRKCWPEAGFVFYEMPNHGWAEWLRDRIEVKFPHRTSDYRIFQILDAGELDPVDVASMRNRIVRISQLSANPPGGRQFMIGNHEICPMDAAGDITNHDIEYFRFCCECIGAVDAAAEGTESDQPARHEEAGVAEQKSPAITEQLGKGVSLQDAAVCIEPRDADEQKELVKSWRNSRRHTLPPSIGKDPGNSSRNLYEPAALLTFLREFCGEMEVENSRVSAYFRSVSRFPKRP